MQLYLQVLLIFQLDVGKLLDLRFYRLTPQENTPLTMWIGEYLSFGDFLKMPRLSIQQRSEIFWL